ncbi:hypothetical protein KQX54_014995 [Cotesia glomerata]|uniref:Uncharacterized protein n=1 Tax=Cotesia glomerata TaxID=32391 RepID=A0AAV7HU78_COTGL|nr:hypothetical protein KQX54_014995 [Cotesia glomerata]
MRLIKQLGRWRSDIIAQGYVENSMHNRQMIFNGITQSTATGTQPQSSTSKEVPITPQQITSELEKESFVLNWSDFEDDLTVDDVELISKT